MRNSRIIAKRKRILCNVKFHIELETSQPFNNSLADRLTQLSGIIGLE